MPRESLEESIPSLKLTKPGMIGASQLSPGVRQTAAGSIMS
jgi:hypothetical protein